MLAIASGFEGFGLGYHYALVNGKAEEVKQGENYYLFSLYQSGEVASLSALVEKVATLFFNGIGTGARILFNVAPFLWFPIGILLASVKHRQYTQIIDYFPNTLKRIFPRTLGKTTTYVLTFVLDHLSSCIKVALLVGIVSLAYMGCHIFSGVFAAAWLYHEVDMRGYLPRKVSLFTERYFPLIANACLIVYGGNLFLRAIAVITSLFSFPYTNQFLTHKIDALVRYLFKIKGPSLAEYEAALKPKKLSCEQVSEIMNGKDGDYEVDPAHCSKPAVDFGLFPKDYDFDKLMQIFDKIQWNSTVIQGKLNDDEQFQNYIQNYTKEEYEKLLKNPKFFISYMREKLSQLVKGLKGDIRPKGEQKDLEVAIENCAMILPYLQKSSLDRITKEDILLKLVVEGGDYCARAIKRASGEIINETMVSSELEYNENDPQRIYERKLGQSLLNQRHKIIQEMYDLIRKSIHIPNAISQDVHGFDMYRTHLSLGFYPLTPQEREQISLVELMLWNNFSLVREKMMGDYRESFDDIIAENETQFSEYLVKYLSSLEGSSSLKEKIIEKWTSNNDDRWTSEETTHRVHRIVLVNLGILRKKAA